MSNKSIDDLFYEYLRICREEDGAEKCGDLVANLDDSVCKELYLKLSTHPETKEKLVKPLWYNYQTQSFRWND